MNIQAAHDFLNFWINKNTGAFYTIPELDAIIDRGQMSLYSDLKPKYATSQLVKDSLAPFRTTYDFAPANMISGFVVVPLNTNYLDLLDIQITFPISNFTFYYPVDLINEDERAHRLNSQIDPVTVTSPVGEQFAPRYFRLYPVGNQYNGTVTFFRRPAAPVFAYTLISGRIPVYDAANSVQLEWKETDQNAVLLKGLESLGINLSNQEVQNFAQIKTSENWQGQNRI